MHITPYGVSTPTATANKKLKQDDAHAIEKSEPEPYKTINYQERRRNKERRQSPQNGYRTLGKTMDLRQSRDRRALDESKQGHIDISA